MEYVRVYIPSNNEFLKNWHQWIHGKVSKHFKRDKERVFDTVQNVRLRLLAKDFIGRWFYKHLTDDLVDLRQAEKILGGIKLVYCGMLQPVQGKRSDPDSLWSVKDLMEFGKFDFERYYYSIQNHNIDSDFVLRLLGYQAGNYGILESMYRQGRLKPSEFTGHKCSGKNCLVCKRGRATLKARGLSLADRWDDSPEAVKKLRWNDSQLAPYLRNWQHKNIIQCVPEYIMRTPKKASVEAGLLKYAQIVIDNEVVNDFKRITRNDDLTRVVMNKGLSPEISDSETVVYEVDEDSDEKTQILRDPNFYENFSRVEHQSDIHALLTSSNLTEEEQDVITTIDLVEQTVTQYAQLNEIQSPKVHRIRNSALKKMRGYKIGDFDKFIKITCDKYGCTLNEILEPRPFGRCVVARTDLFSNLHDHGVSVDGIASYFSYSIDKVVAAINRRCLQEMRSS